MQHDLEQKIEKFVSAADDPFTAKRMNELKANLKEVNSALATHEMGLYGACIDCGETIPKARLEENHETIRCERCAQ
ncbi:TraR/DksA C4-type zinc finger protein [Maridesulfovibrio sp.]|uniref:TraR/DksA C4-type zinc finger protein n=1 Tax=Maridesulfovibrio sp. TaxID=2795000 RepID=UPI002AA8594E|nr:TraR/DksA C4-type zinc finger protein [Maridesulfovibrio sp.]